MTRFGNLDMLKLCISEIDWLIVEVIRGIMYIKTIVDHCRKNASINYVIELDS